MYFSHTHEMLTQERANCWHAAWLVIATNNGANESDNFSCRDKSKQRSIHEIMCKPYTLNLFHAYWSLCNILTKVFFHPHNFFLNFLHFIIHSYDRFNFYPPSILIMSGISAFGNVFGSTCRNQRIFGIMSARWKTIVMKACRSLMKLRIMRRSGRNNGSFRGSLSSPLQQQQQKNIPMHCMLHSSFERFHFVLAVSTIDAVDSMALTPCLKFKAEGCRMRLFLGRHVGICISTLCTGAKCCNPILFLMALHRLDQVWKLFWHCSYSKT